MPYEKRISNWNVANNLESSKKLFAWIPWNLSFRYIHCTGQFTPKMKANAELRLLTSLVWIDSGVVVSQHCLEFFPLHKYNGMTSSMEFMSYLFLPRSWPVFVLLDKDVMKGLINKVCVVHSKTFDRSTIELQIWPKSYEYLTKSLEFPLIFWCNLQNVTKSCQKCCSSLREYLRTDRWSTNRRRRLINSSSTSYIQG